MNTVESTLVSGSELAGGSGAKKGERDPERLRGSASNDTVSKRSFDNSPGGLDKPTLAVERLAAEPRNEPIGDQCRRERAEIGCGHISYRVSAIRINDQLAGT